MATRNKRKKNSEEHPKSNLAQNQMFPDHGKTTKLKFLRNLREVTEKISQDFSGTENRILGALARLDDFLMNLLIQGHSGSAPETSRIVFSINRGTKEDNSQCNPHSESGVFNNQVTPQTVAQKTAMTR